MDDQGPLRLLIQRKLADRRLPLEGISRIWGGPSNGETCDVCDMTITDTRVIETIAAEDGRRQPVQFHARCFYLWHDERETFR